MTWHPLLCAGEVATTSKTWWHVGKCRGKPRNVSIPSRAPFGAGPGYKALKPPKVGDAYPSLTLFCT